MDARRQMDEARGGRFFGFLVSNGRLPCPANPTLASANVAAGIERAGRLRWRQQYRRVALAHVGGCARPTRGETVLPIA